MKIIKITVMGFVIIIAIFGILSLIFANHYGKSRPIPNADLINKYALEYNLDPNLVLAVIKTESDFKEEAVSPMDARGLMQILPETGMWIAKKMEIDNWDTEMLFEPEINIKFGTFYLNYLIEYFDSIDLAIAAYNGGMGNVEIWLDEDRITDDVDTFHEIPFDETRNYVIKVKNNWERYKGINGDVLPVDESRDSNIQDTAHTYHFILDTLLNSFK